MPERRRAVIALDEEVLLDVLQGRIRLGGFPEDAKVVGIHYEFPRRALMLMLEHPSFAVVEPGELAPVICHTVTRDFEPRVFTSLEDLLQ